MKKQFLALATPFVFFVTTSFSQEQEPVAKITTLEGETFAQVRVVAKVGDRVKIMHSDGIKTLNLDELDAENIELLGGGETPEQAELRKEKEAKTRLAYLQELQIQKAKAAEKRAKENKIEHERISRIKFLSEEEEGYSWRVPHKGLSTSEVQRRNQENFARQKAIIGLQNAIQREHFFRQSELNRLARELRK